MLSFITSAAIQQECAFEEKENDNFKRVKGKLFKDKKNEKIF